MMETWYPVALGRDIAAGTSAGVVLQGQEVVVWRDASGQAHAWEDRCPHRGMKLSFGFVRGDHIACLYHGWEYDRAGQCQKIPAHPDLEVPKTICMKTFGVHEAGGMVWVRLAGAAPPPVARDATPVRSLFVDAGLAAVMAALPFGPVTGTAPFLQAGGLNIGLHPVDEGRTALHLTLSDEGDAVEISGMAAAFRRQIEALA
jgi:nitrite reductase/ring-hydroxylating ferredoxin subunit